MIQINDKQDCCGCGACMQRCPKQCISMQEDELGFLYPFVNLSDCIDCGLCEKVCPIINPNPARHPINVFAGINKDENIRLNSSSGGAFTSLAESIISQNGIVFGAKFNKKWEVVHDYTETKEGLKDFRGAKYSQSRIGDTFKKTEFFLKKDRLVLFTGTPCQIAGLKRYLRKDYEKLLCVDIVCHGVPSPMIWKEYLQTIVSPHPLSDISAISFRNKDYGWHKYSLKILDYNRNVVYQSLAADDTYLRGFVRDLYLRPSCFKCPAKCLKSNSDITLADFWLVSSDLDDNKGTSLILVNTEKGKKFLPSSTLKYKCRDYSEALKGNPCIEKSVIEPKAYKYFWSRYKINGIDAINKTIIKMKPTIIQRIITKLKSFIKK